MSPERDPLTDLFELCSGLTHADEAEACELSLEDTPENEQLVADARKLAEALGRLRAESALPPAPDLWQRIEERVRLYQQADAAATNQEWQDLPDVAAGQDSERLLADLYDMCSGALNAVELADVEGRLSVLSEADELRLEADKLAAVFTALRRQSELQPQSDALDRLMARVADINVEEETAQHLPQVSPPPVAPPPLFRPPMARPPVAPPQTVRPMPAPRIVVQRNEARRRAADRVRPLRWLTLASALLLGYLVWQNPGKFWQQAISPDAQPVLAEVEQSQSLEELKQLGPQLAALVGEDLLQLDSSSAPSPTALADRHLLADLARLGSRSEDLDTARFLVRQQEQKGLATRVAPQESFSLVSTAYGAPASAVDPQIEQALAAADFNQLVTLTAGRMEIRYRLLRAWSLVQVGRSAEEIERLLSEIENDVAGVVSSISADVFLAGMYRSLNEPQVALERMKPLVQEVPSLAFQIGQVYAWQLHNEGEARHWYQKLDPEKLAAYREFGRRQADVIPLLDEAFARDLSKWERSEGGQGSYAILREPGIGDVLHQTDLVDVTQAASLVTGEPGWADYEIRAEIRFDETGFRDPRIGIIGYYLGDAQSYRLDIGRESLGFRRRESRWGGHETIRIPSVEPRYPLLERGVWYSVRFRLENREGVTRLAAKVWPRDHNEPLDWTLVLDDDAQPYRAGRVGLMITDCEASVANLEVVQLGTR